MAQAQDGTGEASAEPSRRDRARARRLFSRGTREAEQHDYQAAADHFRSARALVRAPTIDYNLAAVLVEVGELSEARELLRTVPSYVDATDELRQAAEALLAQVHAGGGTYRVEVTPTDADVEVYVDESPVADGELSALWLAPGSYALRAVREGTELAREPVVVAAGDSGVVRLMIAPTPVETARAAPPPVEPLVEDDDDGGIASKWWFWTLTAVLLAGAAVLVVVLVTGSETSDPVQGDFQPGLVRLP